MKTLSAIAVALVCAVPLQAATPEQSEVLVPIQKFFDGLAKRDAEMIKAPVLPGTVFLQLREGKLNRVDLETLTQRMIVPKPTTFQETMHDTVVNVDSGVATAFVPFHIYIDGKQTRCGTDIFLLAKLDGKWMISSVTDTFHAECGK